MLSREENELLTRIEPGTPMGDLFRRYWIPALLSEEIPAADCPPVRVRLLGEDLVAFRASDGKIGLLAEHCAHRGTSLFFGRNEACGLRCIYHGWKYDIEGNVLETPAEPAGSQLKNKVRHPAYPCAEAGGIVFTYMGPKEKIPLCPAYPWLGVPQDQIYIAKSSLECNYLQGLEGDCDSAHLNFLHRIFKPDARREFLSLATQAPDFEFDEMDFGLRAAAIRKMAGGASYARISHFVMPFIGAVPVGSMVDGKLDGFKAVYQVPADDHSTWRYDFFFKWSRPFGTDDSSKRDFVDANFKKLRNQRNNYLQDRERQKMVNFTGITEFLNQDACATESMGEIVDRSVEHLGATDAFIIQVRRCLLRAVKDFQAGKRPPGLIFDPEQNNFAHLRCEAAQLPTNVSWRSLYEDGKR
ncbi:MAG: aromatic ring-hydroxylating dioxygenase subunit alpha [Deltaproteobacteria bacterium]|nr:aromatic ring-hydroxylating dioxygenase subunit alpha [Deltaproteobacteria bacterium]